MNKTLLILTSGLITSSLYCAPITPGHPAYDPFTDASGAGGTTYTVGAFLIGQTNSQGLTWFSAGTSNNFQPVISSGNLSVSNLAPLTGNSVSYGFASASTGDTARLGLGGLITSGTVYYSMAFEVASGLGSLTSAAIVAGFNNSSGAQPGQPGVIATSLELRQSGSGYNVGLNKGTTASNIVWDATDTFTNGQTIFLVGSYTFNTNTSSDDVSQLWINPDPSTFGTLNAPTSTLTEPVGTDITSAAIASFLLRQASSMEPNMVVDDVRIGVTWADVTPIPSSSLATPIFTNLTVNASTKYATAVALSGTIVGPGPTYPNMGETFTVTVNTNTSLATINDATGDFSINYNPQSTPVSSTPYTITYAYSGDGLLGGVTNTSTTLLVNTPLAVNLSGDRPFDGTTTAAAGTLFVANAVSGDSITVVSGAGTLAATGPGAEAITSFGTLTLGGSSASNYTIAGATGTVTITSPFATAGHPIFEPFADATASGGTSYAAPGALVGQTNAQGVSWFATGSGGQPLLEPGTLSYPGLLPDPGTSLVTYSGVSGITPRLDLGTTAANSVYYGGSAYNLYYSMLLNIVDPGNLGSTPAVIAGFNNSTGTQSTQPSVIGARLYTRLANGGYNLGINKVSSNTNDIAWETNIYLPNTTYFVVADYGFSGTPALTNDTASLWVDPSASTFGGAAPLPDVTSSTGGNIGVNSVSDEISSFLLRQGSTSEPGTMNVDELSIGVTWADVTPPGVSTAFKITSEQVTNGNFILTWQSTPGTNYQVIGSTNILAPVHTWTNVGSQITASGTSTSATNPVGGPMHFYSVVSP